jgi:hypothetical protein
MIPPVNPQAPKYSTTPHKIPTTIRLVIASPAYHALTRSYKSSKFHGVPVTFAAIAGTMRNVLCRRQKL